MGLQKVEGKGGGEKKKCGVGGQRMKEVIFLFVCLVS